MRIFFVLALGRSGTKFLSSLLSKDSRGVVHHEPHDYDDKLLLLRHAGTFDQTVDRLLEERFAQLLPRQDGVEFYGEVNSYLRYEVDWLRRKFDPVLIHLVRDGRDFVRSAYIREVYTPRQHEGPILPRDGDPYAERWVELSRFQKLSWYWAHTNEYLGRRVPGFVRFEDLLADYATFEEKILRPTGVSISRQLWQREVGRPKNTSRRFRMRQMARRWLRGKRQGRPSRPLPPWKQWDDRLTTQFWEICGETMRRLGYER